MAPKGLVRRSGGSKLSGLHALLSKDLGMNVSVEDMYEIVASVDEDGNGKLDRDEFGTLLRSLGVF